MAKRSIKKGDLDAAKKAMIRNTEKEVWDLSDGNLLSSGSTLLNLAATNRAIGAYPKGSYIFFVGDSQAGKTWFALSMLAEATINPQFKDHRFIFDEPEYGALMDIRKYFGENTKKRIEQPKSGAPSEFVEEFYFNLSDAIKQGDPFIYILDSMDVLDTKDDDAHFEERKKAHRSGKKATGSYGMAKAKLNSNNMRKMLRGLKNTGSILLVISQTRDKVGFGANLDPKTRGGGRALKFYAHLELWLSVRERIRKNILGKKRHVGTLCRFAVKKNRLTGNEPTVDVPIYRSVGIDDVGSCIRFLIDEGRIEANKEITKVDAPLFKYNGSFDGLVQKIENENKEDELRDKVEDVWLEIESASRVVRKPRYGQNQEA